MKELLELPWQIQIVIVGGYFGYVIAYSGRRSSHGPTDMLAILLCFGGIALLAFNLVPKIVDIHEAAVPPLSAFAAILASVISAIAWRRWVRDWCIAIVKWSSQSSEDGYSTAWETLVQTQKLEYSQLNVTLTDGTILECYPLGEFNDEPNGPCILGGDGALAMYATHITEVDQERRATNKLKTEEGIRMTYIPADKIRDIDMRRSRKKRK